jgi:hypothetical protein
MSDERQWNIQHALCEVTRTNHHHHHHQQQQGQQNFQHRNKQHNVMAVLIKSEIARYIQFQIN